MPTEWIERFAEQFTEEDAYLANTACSMFIHIGVKYVSQPILLIENFPQIDRKVKGVLGKGKI